MVNSGADTIKQPEGLEPSIQDWLVLQGGMPEIWETPKGNFKVVHAYHGKSLAHYPEPDGSVVDTARKDMGRTVTLTLPNGKTRTFPGALVWDRHGGPCARRSFEVGGLDYEKVDYYNKQAYRHDFQVNRRYQGPLGVKVVNGQFRLVAYGEIEAAMEALS